MSALVAMQLFWVNDTEPTFIFEYQFYDFIVKVYSRQDSVQVCACIEQFLKLIATKNDDVREICFNRDSATCLALQKLFPYIYHMNRKVPHEAKIVK